MINPRKFFVPPPGDESDFKELFKRMAAAGAGRPVDKDGIADGPWTPDQLMEAITDIESNKDGVELRTVQTWFQDNERGISPENIRWLARIFGCDDPEATSDWQAELTASQERLVAKRRQRRKQQEEPPREPEPQPNEVAEESVDADRAQRPGKYSLVRFAEGVFQGRRAGDLPVVVFTGAVALALISFTLSVHSIVFVAPDGPMKQVGFLWAPNWTITFLIVLPLYLAFLVDVVRFWKSEWRSKLLLGADDTAVAQTWGSKVAAAAFSYWSVLVVTIVVASGYNWFVSYLVPLKGGGLGTLPVDWGRVAIFYPDVISKEAAVVFTGLVFAYNALCAYLFFTGLVFIQTIAQDYIEIARSQRLQWKTNSDEDIEAISYLLMTSIFRCTALGIVITILMKLQSSYLVSESPDIVTWLVSDAISLFGGMNALGVAYDGQQTAPGLYYSFFCLLAIFAVYLNASVRIRSALARVRPARTGPRFFSEWAVMDATMVLLVATCLMIGEFPGFSFLVIASTILTTYFIFKPALGQELVRAEEIRNE